MSKQITDLDIPLAYRTQANLWKAKYFEAIQELAKANKGIRRLKRRIDRLAPSTPDSEGRCSTCGGRKNDNPYCSNSFHL